jgi:hypothetical protein
VARNVWPELDAARCISGRSARAEDAEEGRAVFYLVDGDGQPMGVPVEVEIPQYGYLIDDTGKVPVLLVQAEDAGSGPTYGLLDSLGGEYVATAEEVQLLGRSLPAS